MKIQLIEKMPRRETVPGLTIDEYGELKAGKIVEVNGLGAQHLIATGAAKAINDEPPQNENGLED